MMNVEMNLEFFRCLILDSWPILNKDSDNVCEDKLKVSYAKLFPSILELES